MISPCPRCFISSVRLLPWTYLSNRYRFSHNASRTLVQQSKITCTTEPSLLELAPMRKTNTVTHTKHKLEVSNSSPKNAYQAFLFYFHLACSVLPSQMHDFLPSIIVFHTLCHSLRFYLQLNRNSDVTNVYCLVFNTQAHRTKTLVIHCWWQTAPC